MRPVREGSSVFLLLFLRFYRSRNIIQSSTRSPSTAAEEGAGYKACLYTSAGRSQDFDPHYVNVVRRPSHLRLAIFGPSKWPV